MVSDRFLDPRFPPTEHQLERRLGEANTLWWQLVADASRLRSPLFEQWRFWGRSHGWLLRLHGGTRTVLYLEPRDGHFVVAFAGVGFEVRTPEDLARVERRLFIRAATGERPLMGATS